LRTAALRTAPATDLALDHMGRREPVVAHKRTTDSTFDGENFLDFGWGSPTASGNRISQSTAMQVTAVYACVSMIAYDVAKLGAQIFAGEPKGRSTVAKGHPIYSILRRPNSWQTPFEFYAQMQAAMLLRGNGYAVILRDRRGNPTQLVPINPDRVALWEAPTGELFYMVTRAGLHEMAILREMPLLIHSDNIFHVRGLSANGLIGLSPIAMEREAIGLAIAQEQLASHWMRNAAQPSTVLATDQELTDAVVARTAAAWEQRKAGAANAGKVAILEMGLKFERLTINASDMEFIAARQFQLTEIARIYRVPMHMLGEKSAGHGNNISQMSQEYLNNTLSTWLTAWEERFAFTFDLHENEMFVRFDRDKILEADIATRYAAWRIASGAMPWLTVDELRQMDGRAPLGDMADTLFRPLNMTPINSDVFSGMADPHDPTLGLTEQNKGNIGSEQTGQGAEGGGRPPADGSDPDNVHPGSTK
jgi:HK97 family phage portal protein